MARLIIQVGGSDQLGVKNRAGLRAVDLTVDVRLKAELQPSTQQKAYEQESSLPKFVPKRSHTPSYSIALNSVMKGDQLD